MLPASSLPLLYALSPHTTRLILVMTPRMLSPLPSAPFWVPGGNTRCEPPHPNGSPPAALRYTVWLGEPARGFSLVSGSAAAQKVAVGLPWPSPYEAQSPPSYRGTMSVTCSPIWRSLAAVSSSITCPACVWTFTRLVSVSTATTVARTVPAPCPVVPLAPGCSS